MPNGKTIHEHNQENRSIHTAYNTILEVMEVKHVPAEVRKVIQMALRLVYHEGGRASLAEFNDEKNWIPKKEKVTP